MIAVQNWLDESSVPARMIMQVHDELVFEVDEKSVEEVRAEIVALMCGAAELAVAIEVHADVGKNWDEAH